MATTLPTGWSQAEFDEWYTALSNEAALASDDAVRKRSPYYIQRNVEEWLATGTTVSPLPTGWSMTEFLELMDEASKHAEIFFDNYILTRTPPELIGLLPNGGVIIPPVPPDWVTPNALLDLDFSTLRYFWNGTTSLANALIVERADTTIALAPNFDGTYASSAANTPRVGIGTGLHIGSTTINYLEQSRDFNLSPWVSSGLAFSLAASNPVANEPPFTVVTPPVGSTSWIVPAGVFTIAAYAIGPGTNGTAGTTNVTGGQGGGGGAFAYQTGITVVPGQVLAIQVPAANSNLPTFLKSADGTTRVSADFASGRTGGQTANSIGAATGAGGSGAAAVAGVNAGGGGGGGAGIRTVVSPFNGTGRPGAPGNVSGGGGGGAVGGATIASTSAVAGTGGVGGMNQSDVGGGAGGTAATAAGAATAPGAGGGGGLTGTGLHGAAGAVMTWTFASGLASTTCNGGGGAGGGGGLGGNGGAGSIGTGGGGGGCSPVAAGTGGAGGAGGLAIAYGGAYATRITASAPNAYVEQPYTDGGTAPPRVPSLVIRPVAITGPILLGQQGATGQTDIRSQLVTGRWAQAYVPSDTVTNPTWRLTIVNAGDVVEIDLAQNEANQYPLPGVAATISALPTAPVPTGVAIGTRPTDVIKLNIAAFPPMIANNLVTMLGIVRSDAANRDLDTGELYRAGWSWLSYYGTTSTPTATFDATLNTDLTMTVTSVTGGLLGVYQNIVGGAVPFGTFITGQTSGTDGGAGTYSFSRIIGAPIAGTFSAMPAWAYLCNASAKDDPDQNLTGVTVVNSTSSCRMFDGWDPPAEYPYFQFMRIGDSLDGAAKAGTVSLSGTTRATTVKPCWADHSKFTDIWVGSTQNGGATLKGCMARLVILNAKWSASQLAEWTARAVPASFTDDYTNGLSGASFARSGIAGFIGSDSIYHSVATGTARIDPAWGYLSEVGSTNQIRNNTAQGAAAGVRPTFWAVPTVGAGLTVTWNAPGTESGMAYASVTIAGTSTGVTSTFIFFESATQIAAAVGQTWTLSAFVSMPAGSMANITSIRLNQNERNAGNLSSQASPPIIPTGAALGGQRTAYTATLVSPTTATLQPSLAIVVPAGGVVNITLRIGLPQYEQSALASSPIATSNAAITRAADSASLPVPWADATAGTLVIVAITAPQAPVGSAQQVLWEQNDGTESNRIRIFRDSASGIRIAVTAGGTQTAIIPIGVVAGNTSFKLVVSWGEGTYAAALDANAAVTISGPPAPTMTTIWLGADSAGSNWGGWLISSTLLSTRTPIPKPAWVADEKLVMDFGNNRYWNLTPGAMNVVRSSAHYEHNISGVLVSYPNNTAALPSYNPAIGNAALGLSVWQFGTEYFLNNATPATQTVTITGFPGPYTFYCLGSGSLQLSGAITATILGSDPAKGFFGATPYTVQLDALSPVTATVVGSLSFMSMFSLPFLSPPMITTTNTRGRRGDDIQIPFAANPGLINPLRGTVMVRIWLAQTKQAGTTIVFSDGTNLERLAANWRVHMTPPEDHLSGLTVVANGVYTLGLDPLNQEMDTVGYHTFAFTYDINSSDYSGTVNVALDGDVRGTYTLGPGELPSGLSNIMIGTDNIIDGNELPMNGYMVRFSYWDTVKNDAELAALTSVLGP